MDHSIHLACAATVVAFTVGPGATAAAGAADHSTVQRTATASGFDWDTPHAALPHSI
ncbi:hypothetical protein ABT095_00180 [Kitasatospora sp. NPDC002227]|uniref:hypothetical protein n=1 Tax=Kitasatospora sp. NPDC002227 TaxID=3154773 RepID=UPI00332C0484